MEPSGDHSLAGSVRSESSCQSTVSFGEIQIREFERIVGDHPDVSDRGPPLAIGWAYYQHDAVPLDEYECQLYSPKREQRRQKRSSDDRSPSRRRISNNLMVPLNGATRRIILQHGFNVPIQEILDMERQVEETKKQRVQTAKQSKLSERVQLAVESAGRKLRRLSGDR